MDIQQIIEDIKQEVSVLSGQGKVASYIPALSLVDPLKFGFSVISLNGDTYETGDCHEKFTIQSVSKVFTFSIAFRLLGEKLWKRVGKEPSGNPFNSLIQLEYEKGIPRNPFINAGGLVIADILLSHFNDPQKEVLSYIRKLTGNNNIKIDEEVYRSEQEHSFTNAALVNYMKSHRNIHNTVQKVLDVYLYACSVSMTCNELARSMLFYANHGVLPGTEERILTLSQSKRINAIMLTCGFYDESGDFAFRVGLPGKSGVSGAIAAVAPGRWGIGVWSPELGKAGNPLAGTKALELFTTQTGVSIF